MSLLSYEELQDLIRSGVINADPANVNSASIDLTLDGVIMVESRHKLPAGWCSAPVDLMKKESIKMDRVELTDEGYILEPGQFILASSVEVFNLPNNISAEYKLKSTLARNGLEHLNAGYADAGFFGSKLTLEFKNMNQFHSLLIKPGMKCGQMIFFQHEPVPAHASYSVKGQYNGQQEVTASKGLV